MRTTNLGQTAARTVALLLVVSASACGLLDVSDPTAIEDEQLENAAGAALLRGYAVSEFYRAWTSDALSAGLFTDELTLYVDAFQGPAITNLVRRNVTSISSYTTWQQLRRDATVAYSKLRRSGKAEHAGEMLALRGYATLRLAATFCPGFPMTELDGFNVNRGTPVTTAQAYERAIADFDSAFTLAANHAQVLNIARMGRGAALLGLGRHADAAAAVADVPTTFTWQARFISGTTRNPFVFSQITQPASRVMSIADRKGGNGLDFVTADDSRIQARQYRTAAPPAGSNEPLYEPAKYASLVSPIPIASGIEARLIEAEAALSAGSSTWLSILNSLRASQTSPPMPPLIDPGTPEARLDLLFRERAFWLFATGHRLADVLRLVRLYGREPDSVLPTGEFHQHGYMYGTAVSFPFDPQAEAGNNSVKGCSGV